MSGIIGSKLNIRGSGRIAKLGTDGQVLTSSGAGVAAAFEDAAGGGLDWQTIVTASTLTAVAGNGYWIDTTSNACTITLPGTASNGDEIMFVDYARNWGTNGIEIDSNGLNYQGDDDSFDVEYGTDGTALHIVYSGATNGWIPTLDKAVADVPANYQNQNGLFGWGWVGVAATSSTNTVSNAGVVSSDITGVGTAKWALSGCEYAGDKGIVAFGETAGGKVGTSNLVSNTGVVASDVAAVGTAKAFGKGATYGGTKGIFAFGRTPTFLATSNLVSDVGVIGSDVAAVAGVTARGYLGACEYSADKDKAIFAFGYSEGPTTRYNISNKISNTGVVASDTAGLGTNTSALMACSYGDDKGIFAFGSDGSGYISTSHTVSNVGVVSDDITGVGSTRVYGNACEYGLDKGIIGFGQDVSYFSETNLVSNLGVVAEDNSTAASARGSNPGACSYN